MSGFPGHLSPQQEEILQQFKAIVAAIPNKPEDSDHYYLRWLRARRFDLTKAETMFRNHMEYRKKYGADTILEDWEPSEVMNECISGGFFGEDIDGHPVWYDNFGNLDPRDDVLGVSIHMATSRSLKISALPSLISPLWSDSKVKVLSCGISEGIHRSIGIEDILKMKCMHSERISRTCMEFSEKKGKLIENITVVIDFENLTFQKHYYWPAIELLKTVLAVEEANNPERTKKIFMIKTPSIFPLCYNIVKHVLDVRTRRKVTVLGLSQSNWQEELFKYISPDQLPAIYGGNRYEPDAECSNYISPGKDVPPKYYLTNQTEANKDEMERVTVGRGSSHKIRYEVSEVGTTVQWEFFSTDYDISFEFHLKKKVADKTEKEIIHPLTRTESHLIPQSGHHRCLVPGTYVLKFDNSYSWTRSKEVFFAVKILPPNVTPEFPPDLASLHSYDAGAMEESEEDEFFECAEVSEQENKKDSNAL